MSVISYKSQRIKNNLLKLRNIEYNKTIKIFNVKQGEIMKSVIIVGAGVCGSSIARELSRYELDITVIEKESDVCCGTSKANSGIVHAGFDAPEGSLMAKLNVQGNKMMERLSYELDFEYKNCGSIVVAIKEEDIEKLEEMKKKGIRNGVENLEVITDIKRIFEMEPNLNKEVVAILYAPTGGIVCPFGLNIAMAENAADNGAKFVFNEEVKEIYSKEDKWYVVTSKNIYKSDMIINAAGVYADKFHNMVSAEKINITPRKGEYMLMDKSVGNHVKHTVFQLPGKLGKGVLVTQTVHGNLLVGPTATDIEDKEDISTTGEKMEEIKNKALLSVENIPYNKIITSFAGLRAHEDGHEFIIGEPSDAKGFVDCAGIESPGLTSAPAIGVMVADIIKEKLNLKEKENFNPKRKGIVNPNRMTVEERNKLIAENNLYGNIICRCETVSEGEIVDALTRTLGAKDMDGVKRRTRAGMGRCQGGFCGPKVAEIISREKKIDITEVSKSGENMKMFIGEKR